MSEYRRDERLWRWAHGLEAGEKEKRVKERCQKLARRSRWQFKGKARVVHPKHGEVIVPGASPYAAILCAAEKWGCSWWEITDAEVRAVDNQTSDATSSVTAGAVPPEGELPQSGKRSHPGVSPQGEGVKKEQPARAGADC